MDWAYRQTQTQLLAVVIATGEAKPGHPKWDYAKMDWEQKK